MTTDAYYVFNPVPVQDRVAYYDVGWAPYPVLDGWYDARWENMDFSQWLRADLDSLLAVPSPVRINLHQYPSKDWDSVYVSFDIIAEGDIPKTPHTTGVAAFVAVTEENHRYPYPFGKWRYAFRDFPSTSSGFPIELSKGDSLHFDCAYRIDPVYNLDQIFTNIFVQVTDTTWVKPDTLPPYMVNHATMLQANCARVVDMASVPPPKTPAMVWLGQNAPNPFSSNTRIAYQLSHAGSVRLSVFTATGQLVTNLVNTHLEPGSYSAAWDGRDAAGHQVGSGMYYYKLDVDDASRTGRMVLLK